jgi:hypothetical protein
VAKVTDRGGNLEAAFFFRLCGDEGERRGYWLRQLYFERLVAAPA